MTVPTTAPPLQQILDRWFEIESARDAPPTHAACVAAAIATADAAYREGQVHPVGPTVARDARWYRTALATYQLLFETRAYAHLPAQPASCFADPRAIRAWLASPSGEPDYRGHTVAEQLGIPQCFHTDDPDINAYLSRLFDAAATAGVFRVDNHTVELWHLADDEGSLDGHLIVLRSLDGSGLASGQIPIDHLIDDHLEGVDAAVSALVNAGTFVNELLAAQQHATAAARAWQGPTTEPHAQAEVDTVGSLAATSPATPAPVRAFPGLAVQSETPTTRRAQTAQVSTPPNRHR